MKMNNRYFKTVAFMSMLLLSLTSLFTSCVREPIDIDSNSNSFDLVIRPRWIELEKRPTGFTAIIYPTNGGEAKTYVSNNVDSMVVKLPAGGYRVLIYNQTEAEYSSISFRHMDSYYDSQISLTENPDPCNYSIKPNSFWANEPAEFAADCCNELYVDPKDIEIARRDKQRIHKVLTMKPHVIISTLYVKLRVKGVYNGYSMSGCIDGLAGSVFPVYFDAGENLASVPITTWKATYDGLSSEWGWYEGKVRVGGMPGASLYLTSGASIETNTISADPGLSRASRSENDPTFKPEDVYLHMRVLLVDLKTIYEYTFPVGDLITRNNNSPLVLDLLLDDPNYLELPYVKPADGSGTSGFNADVEGWNYTESTIRF